jgi:error-prone DNA polymerase
MDELIKPRVLGCGKPYVSPGARKEKLRQRQYAHPERAATPPRRRAGRGVAPLPYAELRAASAFSFLDGASLPEDLVARAAELELPAVALVDRNGVYGAPRFFKAARDAGLRALVGLELACDFGWGEETFHGPEGRHALRDGSQSVRSRPRRGKSPLPARPARLTLLAESRAGYRNLCRLATAAAHGRPKGEAALGSWELLAEHASGLHLLSGGDEGPVARALAEEGLEAAERRLARLAALFPKRTHVELQRHGLRAEEHRNRAAIALAAKLGLPLVATQGVRYAKADDKPLHDVLTSIREHVTLDAAGTRLAAHRERHLQSAAEMTRRFADQPRAVTHAGELAATLDFTLADLGYRFPDYPLPPGETPASYLRQVAWNGARARFRPLTARAQAQIERELALIEKLELAGYFLIVWDLVEFCRRERILAQGRGSAANSAVCYALGITAVDPVKMELLFERFLSEERGEWPDIDLDLPSGDQREKVIQYVYRRYGGDGATAASAGAPAANGSAPAVGAAMTANVITYRDRSAAREVAKSLGFAPDQVDKLSKQLGTWRYDVERGDPKAFDAELAAAGFDPGDARLQLFGRLWRQVQNLPRHLGQHSGGMVIAAGRLDEVVPLEPAAMPGRLVVQWDKDDCADLGIIKVDLLGLGMLNAMEEAVALLHAHGEPNFDLAHLPADDPAVYAALRRADTVGVFQVESRAQMASLPRNAPDRFYDLVIQVAIIRPGPIMGGMVHPFFERRLGRQPVEYLHPSLEPILKRTLGVPLFQEQLLRIAMTCAGFTGGEAEELRRAMGFKRSVERMAGIEKKLRAGMAARGISGAAQDAIVKSITSFALYGFPESHAASFALIAYASAYLKVHHAAIFLISLLNAWPMGFYHPATLVKDAQHHGVTVRPIDVNFSDWRCTWEAQRSRTSPESRRGALPSVGSGGLPFANGRSPSRSPVSRTGPSAASPPPGRAPHHDSSLSCADPAQPGACRLGLRYVAGLRREAGEAIARARRERPFADVEDLARRTGLRKEEIATLAEAGALASFGLGRRDALWQAALAVRPSGPLFAGKEGQAPFSASPASRTREGGEKGACPSFSSPLAPMTPFEETSADFRTAGMTTGQHPLAYLRRELDRQGIVPAAKLALLPPGRRLRTAGAVIVRQRPGTAHGMLFLTLEDETGMSQAIVTPDLLREYRRTIVASNGLVVEGILQSRDGSISVRAERFWPLAEVAEMASHDFH